HPADYGASGVVHGAVGVGVPGGGGDGACGGADRGHAAHVRVVADGVAAGGDDRIDGRGGRHPVEGARGGSGAARRAGAQAGTELRTTRHGRRPVHAGAVRGRTHPAAAPALAPALRGGRGDGWRLLHPRRAGNGHELHGDLRGRTRRSGRMGRRLHGDRLRRLPRRIRLTHREEAWWLIGVELGARKAATAGRKTTTLHSYEITQGSPAPPPSTASSTSGCGSACSARWRSPT